MLQRAQARSSFTSKRYSNAMRRAVIALDRQERLAAGVRPRVIERE
jgi:hypothetical protein